MIGTYKGSLGKERAHLVGVIREDFIKRSAHN